MAGIDTTKAIEDFYQPEIWEFYPGFEYQRHYSFDGNWVDEVFDGNIEGFEKLSEWAEIRVRKFGPWVLGELEFKETLHRQYRHFKKGDIKVIWNSETDKYYIGPPHGLVSDLPRIENMTIRNRQHFERICKDCGIWDLIKNK